VNLLPWGQGRYYLLVYPLLNHVSGHRYPSTPTFGLPCPTTIFTLGIFHWSKRPVPWACAAIPMIWVAIGSSAAFLLDVLPDLGLLVAGFSFVVFRFRAR
jgi:hypothetical protein